MSEYIAIWEGNLNHFPMDFQETTFVFIGYSLRFSEKAMAPHSSSLAWDIPWTEEPGKLQSMGSLRVGHD